MVMFTMEEILSTRGYHVAETVLLNNQETLRHTHEFYELFLIQEGEMFHYCNQQEELFLPGTLCLIKPQDVHSFRKSRQNTVHFINLAFSMEQYEKGQMIWEKYYGGSREELKDHVRLPGSLSQSMILKMMYLMNYMKQEGEIPAEYIVQGILLESFIYLQNQETNLDIIPDWLEYACRSMRKKENYLQGIPCFVELSGKSQEHLTRMMKKYYEKTPSAYINGIRLEQAASLLRTTEDSILDIMLESGFNNVSYFNQRFREAYGVSPSGYRRLNRLTVNP